MRDLTATLFVILLVVACTGGGTSRSSPPTPSDSPPGGLAGREFWSTAVQGHALVPATRVALRFGADGVLGGSAGCNLMGGTWSLAGNTLHAEFNAMTEMGCDEPRMAQDAWVGGFISSGPSATIDGDQLVLHGAGVTMTLLDREVADPDRPLEGTTWILDGIQVGAGDEAVVSSVPSGVRATIRLSGGQIDVDTGCNTGSATVTLDGGTVTVGPLIMTERACEGDATTVERMVTGVLHGALEVEVDGPTLRLTGPDGGLMFRSE